MDILLLLAGIVLAVGGAHYLVDGIRVETANLRPSNATGREWSALIVSGLSYGQHALSIEFASDTIDFSDNQHVALFGGAAINIAEPSTLMLFLSATLVILLMGRKRLKE